MANLNFTRNIGGNSLGRPASVGFGNNSMSGHVTPVFGQRPPSDRRGIPTMGNTTQMGNVNTLGGYNSFNAVFGSGDANTPSLLDLSEFPSLTNRSSGDNVPQPSPMPGAKPYVGMVKQPTSESSEFTMSSEDFPALPGTQNREGASPGGSTSVDKQNNGGGGDGSSTRENDKASSKTGIQTYPDGRVTNIPASMVSDQFGIVGLLTFIRAAETDPDLVSLALGQDLTALGLNLNSPENLYPSFGGPWAEFPCRPQDIDFNVPPEYIINHAIRDKLASMKLSRYKDDLLFFIFYNNVGEVLQMMAASELRILKWRNSEKPQPIFKCCVLAPQANIYLPSNDVQLVANHPVWSFKVFSSPTHSIVLSHRYAREWRYHIEEKVWITQVPGMVLIEKTSTYERGTYYFFDAQNWRKVAKEFHLEYNKLETRPASNFNAHIYG